MMELTINGCVYGFHFGIGFLREINQQAKVPVDGVPGKEQNVGLRYVVGLLIDGDVETLIDVLNVANKMQNPRITKAALEDFLDDESTDIDGIFEEVLGFLRRSNATKKATLLMEEVAKKELERQERIRKMEEAEA